MKVPVLTTLLAQLETAGRPLEATSQQDATLAVEQSDNSAAEALFSQLEASDGGLAEASQAVQQTLARAGDDGTQINTAANGQGFTTWGQSEWSTTGEVAFYRSLANGCLLSSSGTAFVLGLMQRVESDQRWGAGTITARDGVPVAFKGGWGPDSDHGGRYLVRQSAISGSGDRGWVFSMIAAPSDGSFATGAAMVSAIARWVARTVPLDARSAALGCS